MSKPYRDRRKRSKYTKSINVPYFPKTKGESPIWEITKQDENFSSKRWQLPRSCYHLRGHGGAKAAVRDIVAHLPGNPFVFRTDVKSYYASIDHDVLMSQLTPRIKDSRVLNLVEQYIRRTVYRDGYYEDIKRGFTFLGYTIASAGIVGIAPQTRKRFVERLTRLYEQGASVERIGDYVRRWQRWAVSGLGAYRDSIYSFVPNACGASV